MRRTDRTSIAMFAASLSAIAAFASAGCGVDNAIVGGACRSPYVECGGQCILVDSDPKNCGACGHSCGGGVACVAGACADSPDGALGPDGDPADVWNEAYSQLDSSPAVDADDGSVDASGGDADQGDGSADASVPDSSPVDAGCVLPNLLCDGQCIDPFTDSANCGMCGKVCPSNSCTNGTCVGNAAGHIVAVGHDYQVMPAQNSSQARVLANAVFVSKSNPIAVLSFEHYSASADVQNVQNTLSTQAKKQGRSVVVTSTSNDNDIPITLDINSYDVLLVPDQRNAPQGTLASLGTTWSSNTAISDFLHAGGVVVVLDGGSGAGEMPALFTKMGVLNVNAHTTLVSPSLTVLAPGDAVGTSVVSPYVPTKSTSWFDTEPASGTVTYVVGNNASQPVVVHKVVP